MATRYEHSCNTLNPTTTDKCVACQRELAEREGWVVSAECRQDPCDETACLTHNTFHGCL